MTRTDESFETNPECSIPGTSSPEVTEGNNDENHQGRIHKWLADCARATARRPWAVLNVSVVVSLVLSGFGYVAGNFVLDATAIGWASRGTTIANRMTAAILVNANSEYLRYGGERAWLDLTSVVQPTWEIRSEPKEYERPERSRRRRQRYLQGDDDDLTEQNPNIVSFDDLVLRQANNTEFLARGCDQSVYFQRAFIVKRKLWPVWELQANSDGVDSIWHPEAILEICKAEETTQAILEANDLCYGCENGCLDPYSVVFIARLQVQNGLSMTCEQLSEAWTPGLYEPIVEQWRECSAQLVATQGTLLNALPDSCPFAYSPFLVDANFGATNVVDLSSSVFVTRDNDAVLQEIFDNLDNFSRGEKYVKATFDTQSVDLLALAEQDIVDRDLVITMGSAVIIVFAMLVHTRSLFITFVGMLQIMISFPLSYFIYAIIGGYEFFPFLNFLGIFIVLALGADDVFVAMDKWKNCRLVFPTATTEEIAAKALPDAAHAMFLTTLTTSVAFFATIVCDVPPVRLFAFFIGVLVIMDYVLCVLFVFPGLCIYDKAVLDSDGEPSWLFRFGRANKPSASGTPEDGAHRKHDSLIRRILYAYFKFLDHNRWQLFVVCMALIGGCTYIAAQLGLPQTLEVRLLPESVEQERNYIMRKSLLSGVLSEAIEQSGGVQWGVIPTDTGNPSNPYSFSTLVLDEEFDPSSEESQLFLMNFCDDLFEQEFASETDLDYSCPLKAVDDFLKNPRKSLGDAALASQACGDATGIPIPQEGFHECVSAWAEYTDNRLLFFRQEKLVSVVLPYRVRISPSSSFDEMRAEFEITESWFTEKFKNAPEGVNNGFSISSNYWFLDTHEVMNETAGQAAMIALAASAAVILFSSRSFVLTFFSTVSIYFVLASVTAFMVGLGWTLGFLESVCFAILIGVSADFVTHFSHAYASPKGEVTREERTERALILMGPSVLAAAFTTGASALVMMFATTLFFEKFAIILFFSIVQSLISAYLIYCVLTVTMGPLSPGKFLDRFSRSDESR